MPNQTYVQLDQLNSTLVPSYVPTTTMRPKSQRTQATTKKPRGYDTEKVYENRPNTFQPSSKEQPDLIAMKVAEASPNQECEECPECETNVYIIITLIIVSCLCILFLVLYCYELRINNKQLKATHTARISQYVTDPDYL